LKQRVQDAKLIWQATTEKISGVDFSIIQLYLAAFKREVKIWCHNISLLGKNILSMFNFKRDDVAILQHLISLVPD
jgi:hypothetical protein